MKTKFNSLNNAAMAVMMSAGLSAAASKTAPEFPLPISHHSGKTKGKWSMPGTRVLRGYSARYMHVLSGYCADINKAAIANRKSGFQGFRKVRRYIPEKRMSVWVHA